MKLTRTIIPLIYRLFLPMSKNCTVSVGRASLFIAPIPGKSTPPRDELMLVDQPLGNDIGGFDNLNVTTSSHVQVERLLDLTFGVIRGFYG